MKCIIYFLLTLLTFSQPEPEATWSSLFKVVEKQVRETESQGGHSTPTQGGAYATFLSENNLISENTPSDIVFYETPNTLPSIDEIQLALDGAGLLPGVGIFPDFGNVLLSLYKNEWGDALLSVGAMIPGVGQGLTAAKHGAKAAEEAGEEMLTVFRGVSDSHPGFERALKGSARPRNPNGHTNPGRHNAGDTDSQFVSTTTKLRTAQRFAGMNGVVIKGEVPKSQTVPTPDYHDEGEVLVKGEFNGEPSLMDFTSMFFTSD